MTPAAGVFGEQQTIRANRGLARAEAAQRFVPPRDARAEALVSHQDLARGFQRQQYGSRYVHVGGIQRGGGLLGPAQGVGDQDVVAASRRRVHSAESQAPDRVSTMAVLRELIQKEDIAGARRMLNALPMIVTEEPALSRLRRLLAPPIVRVSPIRDVDRRREYSWLSEHARAYRGQWVAVLEDELVASAPTLRELRLRLRALGIDRTPLLHRL